MMTDLTHKAQSCETLIRVYQNEVRLNASTTKLLGLSDTSRVTFRVKDTDRKRVYLAKGGVSGYKLHKYGKQYVVRSRALCKALTEALQGYGTYRVESEDPMVDYLGNTCYSIFFRKYD